MNPSQVVPPSVVTNVKISTPAAVRLGAVPPAQSTDAGQLTVWLPPFVRIKVKLLADPEEAGLENVNVSSLVETVAVTTFPAVISISSVPPARSPRALSASE